MNRWIVPLVLVGIVALLIYGLRTPYNGDPPSNLVNKPAPAFALADYSGKTHTLAEYRGKPVVINFWASWCQPCHAEAPILADLSRRTAGKVQFLGLLYNDATGKDRDFVQQYGITYPTLLDPGSKTAMRYGIGQLPDTFLIDAAGNVVYHHLGAFSDDRKYEAEFEAALKGVGGL